MNLDKIETQEEKEAFEGMAKSSEVPNSSEWNEKGLPPVGVECEMKYKHASNADWRKAKVFAYDGNIAAIWHFDKEWKHATIDTENYQFRKPETPEQKAERERLEAAYDLYCECVVHGIGGAIGFETFKSSNIANLTWLRIVDKTGYRKQND